MTDHEILSLLVYLNELDGRHSPNEIKVKAWAEVLNESIPDCSIQFAHKAAKKHYSVVDDLFTPAMLVRSWRLHQQQKQAVGPTSDAHCRRAGCDCRHHVCYRGWIDQADGSTSPCHTCRPSLAKVLSEIPGPGHRTEADFVRIRTRHLDKGDA